jgi:hypothetical protein
LVCCTKKNLSTLDCNLLLRLLASGGLFAVARVGVVVLVGQRGQVAVGPVAGMVVALGGPAMTVAVTAP